jgi:hypothetical protein
MFKTSRRIGGGTLLVSLVLPWVMVSVNACGQHSSTLTAIQLAVGTQKIYQQAVALGSELGSGVAQLQGVEHALLAVALAVVGVAVAGIAGLAGSRVAFGVGGAAVAIIAWIVSRVESVVSVATTGVVSVSLRSGFFIALAGMALLGVGLGRDPGEQRMAGRRRREQTDPSRESL